MKRIYSMLGLGRKAGFIETGGTACELSIKKKKCNLLIIAINASQNTKDKFMSLCKRYKIKYILFGDKELLGKSTGKESISIIAITDKQFTESLIKKLST
ncbi:L7Ae/L30e/S12e/Gadd45 family ribosomal protein [Caldisalinibacter kiritimatiensis]|uniref:Ribosomal protein L7Ae/L30e/S12e/Gadd45 n=1 Tax=Caldisalinibacter kiritimatiensis TaxID=1304284 RepID=R1AVE0_9FIRM|nr:ribosomal L7Ae/L30e/S12e/Gadd45 family protein [Caldisalinibacter kiritimatiensis]EOD00622.1 ribosomal protein L7Ae/L30e/S12e/Gadd45 [Caldisalinibacter kiritimatiensis]